MSVYKYYVDPFHKDKNQPKIPDGKFETSIGAKKTTATTFTTAVAASPNVTETYIFVFPSIYQSQTIATATYALTDVPNFPPPTHEKIYDFGTISDATNMTFTALNRPAAYRIVSKGITIKNVSADAVYEGFFETVCFPMNEVVENFMAVQTNVPNGQPAQQVGIVPTQAYVNSLANNKHVWRDSKSYLSGTYDEMNKYIFRLPVTDPTHQPIYVPHKINTALSGNGTPLQTTTQSLEALRKYFDYNFQFRVIRLVTNQPNTFFMNTCTNIELVYPLDSNLRLFQTENTNYRAQTPERINRRLGGIEESAGAIRVTDVSTVQAQVAEIDTPQRQPRRKRRLFNADDMHN
jgi:hypothetical protein